MSSVMKISSCLSISLVLELILGFFFALTISANIFSLLAYA